MLSLPPEIEVEETPEGVTYRLPPVRVGLLLGFLRGLLLLAWLLALFFSSQIAIMLVQMPLGWSWLAVVILVIPLVFLSVQLAILVGATWIFTAFLFPRCAITVNRDGVTIRHRLPGFWLRRLRRRTPPVAIEVLEPRSWWVSSVHLRYPWRFCLIAFGYPLPLRLALAEELARRCPLLIAPRCPRCGYDLSELTHANCPECGADLVRLGLIRDGRICWPEIPVVIKGKLPEGASAGGAGGAG